MRHRKRKGRLNRRTSWRNATLKSMANDLFTYERIETTMAKAKALRSFAEPLITMAKKAPESVAARRRVFQKLCDRSTVKNLFEQLAPLYRDTPGGYTRIMMMGNRKGDGAQMAIIELTKRTISDEKIMGMPKGKAKEPAVKKKAKASGKKAPGAKKKEEEKPEKAHAAPEVNVEEKEERSVEEVRKEKAKTEQKKISKKGIFKMFRRKSMG